MKNRHHVAVIGFLAAFAGAATPSPDEIDRAVRNLGSESFETRDAAFRKLLEMGIENPEAVLGNLPADSADPEVRNRLEILRRQIPAEQICRKIQSGQKFAPEEIRKHLLTTFEAPHLVRTINDLFLAPKPEALYRFARCLDETRKEPALLVFDMFMDHDDPALRLAAVVMTGPLLPLIDDPRKWAFDDHTPAFQGPRITKLLLAHLKTETAPLVRREIIRSLARRPDRATAREAILDLFEDPDVRGAALEAARSFPDCAVTDHLLTLLKKTEKDGDENGRCTLLGILGDRPDAGLENMFERLLSDKSDEIVRVSIGALARRHGKAGAGRFARFLEHDFSQFRDPTVRGDVQCVILDQLLLFGERSVIPRIVRFMETGATRDFEQDVAGETILNLAGTVPAGPIAYEEFADIARAWWEKHENDAEFQEAR